jgi:hypothetical protein
MHTLSIQLDDHTIEFLTRESIRAETTVEELAARVLREVALSLPSGNRYATDAEFRSAMMATLSKNAELYQRLAKH